MIEETDDKYLQYLEEISLEKKNIGGRRWII